MLHPVLALALAAALTSPNGSVPANAAPPELTAVAPEPIHTQFDGTPRISMSTFALNTLHVLARPIQPKTEDAWVIVPTIIGAGLVWNYDRDLHDFLHNRVPDPVLFGAHRTSWYVSYGGEGLVDVGVFGAFAMSGTAKGERVALEGMEALTATAIASRLGKLVFREERPSYDPHDKIMFSDRLIAADSFPSGHTMSVFATAAVIAREYPEYAPVLYSLATIVGIARVQQSTHWPTDVVVGAGLGLLFGWAAVEVTHGVHLSPSVSPDGAGAALSGTL